MIRRKSSWKFQKVSGSCSWKHQYFQFTCVNGKIKLEERCPGKGEVVQAYDCVDMTKKNCIAKQGTYGGVCGKATGRCRMEQDFTRDHGVTIAYGAAYASDKNRILVICDPGHGLKHDTFDRVHAGPDQDWTDHYFRQGLFTRKGQYLHHEDDGLSGRKPRFIPIRRDGDKDELFEGCVESKIVLSELSECDETCGDGHRTRKIKKTDECVEDCHPSADFLKVPCKQKACVNSL